MRLSSLFVSFVFSVALVGCQKPAPAPKNEKPVENKTSPSTAATKIPSKLPPAPDLSPATTFATIPDCIKSGYNDKQCGQASNVAAAMHNTDAPKYPTLSECVALFLSCAANPKDKNTFSPLMGGFSVAGQKKGDFVSPTKEAPLYLLPLYKAKNGQMVEIKIVAGKMVLLPVGQKLKAPEVSPSPKSAASNQSSTPPKK